MTDEKGNALTYEGAPDEEVGRTKRNFKWATNDAKKNNTDVAENETFGKATSSEKLTLKHKNRQIEEEKRKKTRDETRKWGSKDEKRESPS